MHVACTWVSAVWPWACMQRPEEGALSSFSLFLIPLRHGQWARSLPYQPGWMNREFPWCTYLCSPNTIVTGIWIHSALYIDVTDLNAAPTLAQHSTLSYPCTIAPTAPPYFLRQDLSLSAGLFSQALTDKQPLGFSCICTTSPMIHTGVTEAAPWLVWYGSKLGSSCVDSKHMTHVAISLGPQIPYILLKTDFSQNLHKRHFFVSI